jgi:hypothetical protein
VSGTNVSRSPASVDGGATPVVSLPGVDPSVVVSVDPLVELPDDAVDTSVVAAVVCGADDCGAVVAAVDGAGAWPAAVGVVSSVELLHAAAANDNTSTADAILLNRFLTTSPHGPAEAMASSQE